jgi:hypothetical protein
VQILAKCPKCDAALPVDAREASQTIRCGGCGREIPLTVSAAVREDRATDVCPVCAGGDFYVRRDFDPQLGLAVIIVAATISAVFYWFGRDLLAYSVLGLGTLIDFVVYGKLKDVTVCYRCHTEFRGSYPRTAPAFDLHTADVLELEYRRRTARG